LGKRRKEGRKKESNVLSVAVVLEARGEGTQFCWMPSGHVVGKEARYSQPALGCNHPPFESLIAQLQDKVLEPAPAPLAKPPGRALGPMAHRLVRP
jgi:hypothetical protein